MNNVTLILPESFGKTLNVDGLTSGDSEIEIAPQVKRQEDREADDLEILWLEVCPYKSSRSLFIGGVYRPPSFRVADEKRLGKNIENVHLLNKKIILLGDIDIDFLSTMKFQKHPFIKRWKIWICNNL